MRPLLFMDETGLNHAVGPRAVELAGSPVWLGENRYRLGEIATLLGFWRLGVAYQRHETGICISETSAMSDAERTITVLQKHASQSDNTYRLTIGGNKLIDTELPKDDPLRTIKLLGKDGHADWPSCDVIDICVQLGLIAPPNSVLVGIFSESMRPQQERVYTLGSLLVADLPIVRAYYDQEGRVQIIDNWSDNNPRAAMVANVLAHAFA